MLNTHTYILINNHIVYISILLNIYFNYKFIRVKYYLFLNTFIFPINQYILFRVSTYYLFLSTLYLTYMHENYFYAL